MQLLRVLLLLLCHSGALSPRCEVTSGGLWRCWCDTLTSVRNGCVVLCPLKEAGPFPHHSINWLGQLPCGIQSIFHQLLSIMRSAYLLWAASAALCLAADMEMKGQILGSCSSPSEPYCCARHKIDVYEGGEDDTGREVYVDQCKSLPNDS